MPASWAARPEDSLPSSNSFTAARIFRSWAKDSRSVLRLISVSSGTSTRTALIIGTSSSSIAAPCGLSSLHHRVIRRARPDPGLVLVEVDPHHLPLADADEVVDEPGAVVPALVPEKHHADLSLGGIFGGLDGGGVVDALLQDEVFRVRQRAQALRGRSQLDAQAGEGVERLQ